MKILLDSHKHDKHHRKYQQHKGKKNLKLMKKIAKLEEKMSKYNFESAPSDSDSCSSNGSDVELQQQNCARSRGRRFGRRQHRHGRRHFASRERSSSGSSSSAESDSDSSGSSSSSRSPSPPRHRHARHHRRHQHGPPKHLSRSRSFAGYDNRSPSPHFRCHRRQHHNHHSHHHNQPPPPPHHRGQFSNRHCCGRDGVAGRFKLLPENGNNQGACTDDGQDFMDLVSPPRSPCREQQPDSPAREEEQDVDVQETSANDEGNIVEGPEIDAVLAENWTRLIREGLPEESGRAILDKYPTSKNCPLLRGPKLNEEIVSISKEAVIDKDKALLREQNQLGCGLAALGKAITDLNNIPEPNQQVTEALENLNGAAVILLDVHRSKTEARRAAMLPEINKRFRAVLKTCEPDELLFGSDLREKMKNVKGRGKYKKDWKNLNREAKCAHKAEKRKHADHEAEGRNRGKHAYAFGPWKKGSAHGHRGPKQAVV